MCRDPFYITWCKCGCHGFAAVSTAQTTHLLPYFLFKLCSQVFKPARSCFFKPVQKPAHTFLFIPYLLFKGTEINGLHLNHRSKIQIESINAFSKEFSGQTTQWLNLPVVKPINDENT